MAGGEPAVIWPREGGAGGGRRRVEERGSGGEGGHPEGRWPTATHRWCLRILVSDGVPVCMCAHTCALFPELGR